MVLADTRSPAARARAGALVAALHLLIGYALLTGLGVHIVRTIGSPLRVFNVAPVPPPPNEAAIPAPVRVHAPEGAAAPPSLRARPTPIVAPRRAARSPVRAAPEPLPSPTGSASRAGASRTPGPGTGAGGQGSDAGAGRGGSGTGGGGMARPAQRISGAFDYADHPDRPRPNRAEVVGVRFLVGADGRVRDCSVTRSSGNPRVDAATCRLIEQRFRYRPAQDANGNPVAASQTTVFSWIPDGPRRR
jgi:protein TonB